MAQWLERKLMALRLMAETIEIFIAAGNTYHKKVSMILPKFGSRTGTPLQGRDSGSCFNKYKKSCKRAKVKRKQSRRRRRGISTAPLLIDRHHMYWK